MGQAHDRERLKGHLDLLLLSVLARGPAHGYAVISALRRSQQRRLRPAGGDGLPGPARLERAGLLIAQRHRAARARPQTAARRRGAGARSTPHRRRRGRPRGRAGPVAAVPHRRPRRSRGAGAIA